MSEDGTAFSTDKDGGHINAPAAPALTYKNSAVIGRLPRDLEPVCFVRDPNDRAIATEVRAGSCAAANLAKSFKATFDEQLAGRDIGEAAHGEIKRLADQRAERALRAAPGVATVPDHLLKARSAVGHATMVLLAIEVQSLDGEVTVKTLRTILRRQRPTLPR